MGIGIKHDRLTVQDRIHDGLAVHAHGNRLAQADIPEGSFTVAVLIPAGEDAAVHDRLNRVDVEVSMFPGGAGDEGGVDLPLGLQL